MDLLMESPYGIHVSLWKIFTLVLGTGIERDMFLYYFIMILCIIAIFILLHISDEKFIFILYPLCIGVQT